MSNCNKRWLSLPAYAVEGKINLCVTQMINLSEIGHNWLLHNPNFYVILGSSQLQRAVYTASGERCD